ncbi:hypothetical protein [Hymenobacter lapidiphilus]|uniref:Uncharacterized protein n=1 Tax=Hymenobacter lapidiphilus TaxID=2608003 RepID=A0A7Y7PLZ0_9BACT|nr:hypothetical protein [Hymenobacter lapidiphilus]NVO30261.1 hypothetical protein [Hymenobacter lapidiphilus]
MCSSPTPVAPAPVGAGTWAASLQGLSPQQRLAACTARLEELAVAPLLPPDLMAKFGPLLTACTALAATSAKPSK